MRILSFGATIAMTKLATGMLAIAGVMAEPHTAKALAGINGIQLSKGIILSNGTDIGGRPFTTERGHAAGLSLSGVLLPE
jgi:hypothetical protein